VKRNSTNRKKSEWEATYRARTPAIRRGLREVKLESLVEPDSRSEYVSGATDINYKNTCIIVLDISLLKDPAVIQLLM